MKIKTGKKLGAGTDADVYLKIFGKNGDSDKIQLRSADNQSNKFEAGQTDHFTLEFGDLGKVRRTFEFVSRAGQDRVSRQIEHIIIGHNGKNPGAGWFLESIEIDVPMRGEFYR